MSNWRAWETPDEFIVVVTTDGTGHRFPIDEWDRFRALLGCPTQVVEINDVTGSPIMLRTDQITYVFRSNPDIRYRDRSVSKLLEAEQENEGWRP